MHKTYDLERDLTHVAGWFTTNHDSIDRKLPPRARAQISGQAVQGRNVTAEEVED